MGNNLKNKFPSATGRILFSVRGTGRQADGQASKLIKSMPIAISRPRNNKLPRASLIYISRRILINAPLINPRLGAAAKHGGIREVAGARGGGRESSRINLATVQFRG